MDNTIDPALAILLKHGLDRVFVRQVNFIRVDLGGILVLLRGVLRQGVARDLL